MKVDLNVKKYLMYLGDLLIASLFLANGFIHSNIINIGLYIVYGVSIFIYSLALLVIVIGWKNIKTLKQDPIFNTIIKTRILLIDFILSILPLFLYLNHNVTYSHTLFIMYLLVTFAIPIINKVVTFFVITKKYNYVSLPEYYLLVRGDNDALKNIIEEYKSLKDALLMETTMKGNSKVFKDLAFEYYNRMFKVI